MSTFVEPSLTAVDKLRCFASADANVEFIYDKIYHILHTMKTF